jgi:5'-3' exonuclease
MAEDVLVAYHLYLDAPSLVYRAFFALPKTITDDDGNSVNAVRGFMDMTAWLVQEHRPDEFVAVFDADWRPAFRVEAYAGYKSDRPEDPSELPGQFEVLAAVLDAAGIPRAEAVGLEADDVLGTLVDRLDGDSAGIVTGDRDLMCLVRDPDVRLLYTVKGVRKLEEYDEAAVESKYGIPPRLYAQFAMLRGDPSDDLPGVPGIGPKRAATLLNEFGSIEGILAGLHTLPERQAQAFRDATRYLEAMRTVVPLVADAEIVTTAAHQPNVESLQHLALLHNLGGSSVRLLEALA